RALAPIDAAIVPGAIRARICAPYRRRIDPASTEPAYAPRRDKSPSRIGSNASQETADRQSLLKLRLSESHLDAAKRRTTLGAKLSDADPRTMDRRRFHSSCIDCSVKIRNYRKRCHQSMVSFYCRYRKLDKVEAVYRPSDNRCIECDLDRDSSRKNESIPCPARQHASTVRRQVRRLVQQYPMAIPVVLHHHPRLTLLDVLNHLHQYTANSAIEVDDVLLAVRNDRPLSSRDV
uniref:Autophagy-related protein n=1 Tax=Macrostomum lignano TaxID=282301 RepID=A0A1I8FWK7_9PLAT